MKARAAVLGGALAAAACGGRLRSGERLPASPGEHCTHRPSATAPVAGRVEWSVAIPGEGPPRLMTIPGGDWLVTRTGDTPHDLILGSIDGLVSKVSADGVVRWSKRLSEGTYAIHAAIVERDTLVFGGGFRGDVSFGRFPLKDTAPAVTSRYSPAAGFVVRTSLDLDVLAANAVPSEVTSLDDQRAITASERPSVPAARAPAMAIEQVSSGESVAPTPFVIRAYRGASELYRRTFGAGGDLSLGPDPILVHAEIDEGGRAVLITTGIARARPMAVLIGLDGRVDGTASLDPGYRCSVDDWPGTSLELRDGFVLVSLWCPRPDGESGPSTVLAKITR